MPRPTNVWSVSLVGPGKVGTTLAALLGKKGHRVRSVIGRRASSARLAGRVLKALHTSSRLSTLSPETDLLILAVPDELLGKIAGDISRLTSLTFERLAVFHPSGPVTSDVLEPLASRGAKVFSLHPIQTFPGGVSLDDQVQHMQGIWYGFEGAEHHASLARRIVRDLGGQFVSIPKEEKILYHAACVFAANYPIVLLEAVEQLSRQVGLPGLTPFSPLVETAIREAFAQGPAKALTGPVVRGSAGIVRRHLEALTAKDPALASVYRALGSFAVRSAGDAGRISPEKIRELAAILSDKT